MMGAYFHQDFDLEYHTEDEAIVDFASTGSTDDLARVIHEIDVLSSGPTRGLLSRFDIFADGIQYLSAQNDEDARAWLAHARDLLAMHLEQRPESGD